MLEVALAKPTSQGGLASLLLSRDSLTHFLGPTQKMGGSCAEPELGGQVIKDVDLNVAVEGNLRGDLVTVPHATMRQQGPEREVTCPGSPSNCLAS